MLITMGVSLYTSRVILEVLGAEDFGIYGIVGSIIVLFSFIRNAMTGASQRFFSFELGKGEANNLKNVFSVSLVAHLLIVLVVFLLGETIGLWYVMTKLNIPSDRFVAAQVTYQLSLIAFAFSIIRTPYSAIIIAYEKMSFFAYVSIFEVFFKLLIVYILLVISYDKLIEYSFLMLIVTVIFTVVSYFYCVKKFEGCSARLKWDKGILMHLLSFTGWSLCGNVANVTAQQGGNIILNVFFGVVVNAAYGLANQVSSVIYGFVSNFQMAFRPQIVKLYACNQRNDLFTLALRSSRLSFYLVLLIAVPFIQNADYLFALWLKDVPDYSVVFCRLMMIYCMIDAIQAPLWMMIDATGNIKQYSIWLSVIILLNLPLSYFLLKMGAAPEVILYVRVILNLITAIIRTIYMKYFIDFPSGLYVKQVIPCLFICTIAFVLTYYTNHFFDLHSMLKVMISLLVVFILIIVFGVNKQEKEMIRKILFKRK